MNDDLKIKVDDKTISVEQILSNHRCRFVLDGEHIRLDHVRWADDRVPLDAEDVLEDMWAQAFRYRRPESRA